MKTTIHILILAALVLWTMVSCTAFTAPRDPVTGIRQDAPPEWDGTRNPLDFPRGEHSVPETTPPPSMGNFGPHSEFYR